MNKQDSYNFIHFSLAPYVYATRFDDAVIILDGKNDKYLSLIDDTAHFFCFILANQFIQNNNGTYIPLSIHSHNDDVDI